MMTYMWPFSALSMWWAKTYVKE